MRRLGKFALLVLAIACADAVAPRSSANSGEYRNSCWAYVTLPAENVQFQLWAHFTPCPSDSALAANGWTRGLNPMWAGR